MFSRCCLPFDAGDLEQPETYNKSEHKSERKSSFVKRQKSKKLEHLDEQSSIAANPCLTGRLARSKLEWNHNSIPDLVTRRRYAAAVSSEKGELFVIGGYDGQSPLSSIESLGYEGNGAEAWEAITAMKAPNSGLAAAMVGETIFVVGGFHGSRRQASASSFNTETKEWKELPKMNQRRGGCAAVVLNDTVHVIGGHDGSIHLSTVEAFQNGSWSVLSSQMKERRFNCAAAVVNGSIYVVGGESERGVLSSVECFCDGQWTQLQPMRTARKYCCVVALQHCLVVAGGNDGSRYLKTCEMYNTITKEWTALPNLQVERGRCSAVATNDSAYVIGGFDGMDCLSSVEKLDVFHVVPTPPSVPDEPSELHKSARGLATAGWISQAHVVVESFKSSLSETKKQVHEDYAFKQQAIQEEIEALLREMKQAEADRDVFLNDLQTQTNPWFRYQRSRMMEAKEKVLAIESMYGSDQKEGNQTPLSMNPDFGHSSSSDTPDELKCPITMEVMKNPVIAADGITYERRAIERVFQSTPIGEQAISPKTNLPLPSRILVDNVNVRSMCREYQVETREDNETERGVRSL